jgi:hypothetical protein
MRYADRLLIGMFLILCGVAALWYGSPARTGAGEPIAAFAYAFVFLFALGFVIFSMALLGSEDDYPAFLSGLVLYFIVGALVAVFLYVTRRDIGFFTLDDAADPRFWAYWFRVGATWPLELVIRAELLGYEPIITR